MPFREGTAFDAWNRPHRIRSREPLFYLVERGPRSRAFDGALRDQALALGVDIRFGSRAETLAGPGILATGPKAGDAIAAGYHFDTDAPDGFWIALDDELAPKGYAYLLVSGGRGTLKTCMFAGFRDQATYVERTVERLRRLTRIGMNNMRFHGGAGNMRVPDSALSGSHFVVGEQAGFQDAFAGFGMRYAFKSGVMAARAHLAGDDYDARWRTGLRPLIEASLINRAVYARLGNRGYRWLLRLQTWQGNARASLGWLYRAGWRNRVLLSWAQRSWHSRRNDASCQHADCTCVWCRCGEPLPPSGKPTHGC